MPRWRDCASSCAAFQQGRRLPSAADTDRKAEAPDPAARVASRLRDPDWSARRKGNGLLDAFPFRGPAATRQRKACFGSAVSACARPSPCARCRECAAAPRSGNLLPPHPTTIETGVAACRARNSRKFARPCSVMRETARARQSFRRVTARRWPVAPTRKPGACLDVT